MPQPQLGESFQRASPAMWPWVLVGDWPGPGPPAGWTPLWLSLEIWVGDQPADFQDSESTGAGPEAVTFLLLCPTTDLLSLSTLPGMWSVPTDWLHLGFWA